MATILNLIDTKLPVRNPSLSTSFIITKHSSFRSRLSLRDSNMFITNTILSGLSKKLLPPYIKNKIHIT